MPRNMSFFLTTDQVRNGTKTVTRRKGWRFLKPGDILNACVKCQGLGKGGKIEKIRPIQIISTRWEPIEAITTEDVILEGFPDWFPNEFIDMYCKANKQKPTDLCNRIEFRYLVPSDYRFKFKNLCPYCDGDMEFYTEAWTQDDDGTWYTDEAKGDCMTMPDFESPEWKEWNAQHSYMPYEYIFPLQMRINKLLKDRVRFQLKKQNNGIY